MSLLPPVLGLVIALTMTLPAAAGTNAPATALLLLPNGTFEAADPTNAAQPAHWDRPDGLGVQWIEAPDDDGVGRGRAIRVDTAVSEKAMEDRWRAAGLDQWSIPKPANGPIAATYGLSFYSEAIPVRSNQAYRITFDFRGSGGGAKVWVRAYGQYQGEKRRRFETIVNPHGGSPGQWRTFSQCFHPTRLRPECTEMRVMLYAYWPPGVYWFDNVRIEPASDVEYRRDMGRE